MNRTPAKRENLRGGQAVVWICGAGCLLFHVPVVHADSSTDAATNSVPSFDTSPAAYKKLSLEQLMNLDVTSVSRAPQPYGEAPAAIDVITSDEIRRSGASSIPEALRLADNLDVAQKNSHDWGISARGFNTDLSNKLLVLMDGRSVYTPLYSGVFWDQQDYLLADIDHIEVISGPGGTLWGANAVNGVINIITKSAKDTQGLYTEAGGGSWLRDFGAARYGGTLATNVYYRVYAKYFDRNSEVLPDGSSAMDAWRMGQGGFRIDSEAWSQTLMTLQGDFYLGDEGVETGGQSHTGGGNVLGRWTRTFSDDADMSLQMYYDRTHLSDPVPAYVLDTPGGPVTLAPSGTLVDDLDTYDLDYQDRFRVLDRNQFTWGLGYRFTHEVDQNAPAVALVPPTLDQNLYSGFVQDDIRIFDPLHFILGTKVEHNDYTGFEVQPSGRLKWDVTDNQMIWAAVSRAVRTPSRIDHDLQTPGPGAPLEILAGNPNFKSETLIAYEIGYRAQIGAKTSGSLSAFYNDYNDIRSTAPTPGTVIPFVFQNELEGDTYGFESTLDYQLLDGWRMHAGYDLLKEDLHVQPGATDINDAHNETADPQQQFFLRSSMDLPWQTELDLDGRWIDTVYNNSGPDVGDVPSYFEMNVRLGWHVTKNVELSVVGENLLHDQHPEYGYPGPTREEIARSVYGKVVWQF